MSEKHSPLDQFKIEPIMPMQLGGYDISFTNSTLFMLLTIISVTAFLVLGMRKKAMIPGRWQSLSEMSYEFVGGLIKENIGSEGRKFFPFIFTLFMFILFCNLLGMMPYSFTVTSHIAVTFALAMIVFITVIAVGVARHGFHFLHLFIPAGVPTWLAFIIFPIEVMSFLARPISLSVRLAAAMTAGHVLLKVIAGFVVTLGAGFYVIGGVIPFIFIVFLIGLEIFIAFLQAYIFSMLTTIYLNDAINLH
jgi:F-type H+-transporting ATPase subunit a